MLTVLHETLKAHEFESEARPRCADDQFKPCLILTRPDCRVALVRQPYGECLGAQQISSGHQELVGNVKTHAARQGAVDELFSPEQDHLTLTDLTAHRIDPSQLALRQDLNFGEWTLPKVLQPRDL
jgi:hypothetical protein